MIERVLAVIGGLSVVVVLIVLAFAAALALETACCRRRRAAAAHAQRATVPPPDRICERMQHDRAVVRGRIHHPLQHPVEQTSIDELMPRVVEVPE